MRVSLPSLVPGKEKKLLTSTDNLVCARQNSHMKLLRMEIAGGSARYLHSPDDDWLTYRILDVRGHIVGT